MYQWFQRFHVFDLVSAERERFQILATGQIFQTTRNSIIAEFQLKKSKIYKMKEVETEKLTYFAQLRQLRKTF